MITSDSDGCAWTLRAISSAVSSKLCARVNSGSSSVTSGPIRCAPRISPYLDDAVAVDFVVIRQAHGSGLPAEPRVDPPRVGRGQELEVVDRVIGSDAVGDD